MPAQAADPVVSEAFASLYQAAGKCTLAATPTGRIEFKGNGARLPVVLDAASGRFIEPLLTDDLRLEDVPARVGALYEAHLNDSADVMDTSRLSVGMQNLFAGEYRAYSVDERFTLRITSYQASTRSFTGLIKWMFRAQPNRVRGQFQNGILSWREYRDMGGVEVPGALFSVTDAAGGAAGLMFSMPAPEPGGTGLEIKGKFDLRPRGNGASQGQAWTRSPHDGEAFPPETGKEPVFPLVIPFVRQLAELGAFLVEEEDMVYTNGPGRLERSRDIYVLRNAYPVPLIPAYCGQKSPPYGGSWTLQIVCQEGGRDSGFVQRWLIKDGFLEADTIRTRLPRIPCILRDRASIVPSRSSYPKRVYVSKTIYLSKTNRLRK